MITTGPTDATRIAATRFAGLMALLPSLLLYAIACLTPAIEFLKDGAESQRWYGIEALLPGWQGAFVGQFGWFANPFLLIAGVLILFRRFLAGAVVAALAILVAAHSPFILHQQVPGDEGNVTHLEVTAFGVGFYFWVASLVAAMAVSLFASLLLRYQDRKRIRSA
jgi:hypothetical protein